MLLLPKDSIEFRLFSPSPLIPCIASYLVQSSTVTQMRHRLYLNRAPCALFSLVDKLLSPLLGLGSVRRLSLSSDPAFPLTSYPNTTQVRDPDAFGPGC